MEDFGDIKQADNIAFLITNRLMSTLTSHICKKNLMEAYQVPEVTLDHKLESLRRARGIPSHHRVPGHDLADWGVVGVKTIRSDL